jgi:hypothetical protein
MEERIIAADPVADPQGYRRELLALLGDDDPAQVLAATLADFQDRTDGLPGTLVGRRPEPGEWSVAELWERAGVHEERGPTSFRVATDEIAGHARAHQLQLEQTIAAVRR